MRSIGRVFALLICLSSAVSAYAQTFSNTSQGLNNAAFWLEADSLSMVRQARTTLSNGTYGFWPCCTGFYPNVYPRDYDYMLQGCPEAFSNTEMENMCMTAVNEGAAGIDGAVDNPLFEVDVAYRTYMNTGDPTLLSKTLNNGSTLVNGLVSLMNGVPRQNGMVYVASGIGYGFQDTVTVTGNDFYCSLLDVQASNQLAALLTATGNTSAAATWTAAAKAETTDIQNTFWNSSDGMFHASTGTCSNNISVWGSAFAVTSGVASASQSSSIANYFNNNYSNLVLAGQIREIPSPTYWASSWEPAGSEQNGGYWGLPEGQFDSVLATVNPTLAKQTLLDYCNFLNTTAPSQLHPGPEWTGSGSVANGARYYCANVTMPLATAKQYMLSAQPTLQSMKGALNSSADIALASKGGVAFAQDQLSSSNSAANVNDGVYGNNSCWIAGNQSSFVGVAFNKAYTISDLAFGRDNSGAYSDRYQGTYIFQYTTIANPNASTPDADWTSFGGFYLDSVYPNTTNNYRHLYNFAPISGVTGVRIEVDSDWFLSSFASGGGGSPGFGAYNPAKDAFQYSATSAYYIGIDEMEVYATMPGDANGDGRVDINDLTIVLANYNQTGQTWTQGEFTGSGTVDINDLTIVLASYNTSLVTSSMTPTAVPEPAAVALLLAGAACLLAFALQRRRTPSPVGVR